MSIVSDLKKGQFRKRLLRDVAAPRQLTGKPPHPDHATHLTILFPADSAEDRKAVDRWRDANSRSGRKLRLLGYFEQEVGSASFDFSVVSVRDLNWFGLPQGEVVEQFRQEPTEILLRLGPPDHPVLNYLAAIRPAMLKVGPYSATDLLSYYQILFDAGATARPDQQFAAIQQIFSFTNAH